MTNPTILNQRERTRTKRKTRTVRTRNSLKTPIKLNLRVYQLPSQRESWPIHQETNLAFPREEVSDGCVPQSFLYTSCAYNSVQLPSENNVEEPTSTLVLTSSQGQFVDIRIFCKPGDTLPNEGK
jgi:hypothetical protein